MNDKYTREEFLRVWALIQKRYGVGEVKFTFKKHSYGSCQAYNLTHIYSKTRNFTVNEAAIEDNSATTQDVIVNAMSLFREYAAKPKIRSVKERWAFNKLWATGVYLKEAYRRNV